MEPEIAQIVVLIAIVIAGAIAAFFLIKRPAQSDREWTPEQMSENRREPVLPRLKTPIEQPTQQVSKKKKLEVFLFCLFLGNLGMHRFYVGKIGTGIIQLVTLGGLGVWSLCDFIMILCGSFKDVDGNLIVEWM